MTEKIENQMIKLSTKYITEKQLKSTKKVKNGQNKYLDQFSCVPSTQKLVKIHIMEASLTLLINFCG